MAHHVAFQLVLAVGRPVPPRVDLSLGLLGVLTTWWLASPRAADPREQGSAHSDLPQKSYSVISTISYWLHRQP